MPLTGVFEMVRMKNRLFSIALVIAVIAPSARPAAALSINSSQPGNLFTAGRPIAFQISGGPSVAYSVTDYWGKTVASGSLPTVGGTAALELANLPPGWYQLAASDDQGKTSVSLGVVLDRHGEPLSSSGRIAADAASAWLLKSEAQRVPFAKIVATAGIPWVRERTSWSQTEPQRGSFDWTRYDSTLQTLHSQGISVDEIWHDTPAWVRGTDKTRFAPDDLRNVYDWTLAANSHYHGQISSWEVWNEMDGNFWTDLGDRYAAFQKAAYWGLKDADPATTVLMGSLAVPPSYAPTTAAFAAHIYQAGITDYFDKFNWHLYMDPAEYAPSLSSHWVALSKNGGAIRPAWMTEAGIHVNGTEGDGNRLLNTEAEHTQAQFVGMAAADALAAGTERFFFFVLPDYMEGSVQFGALKPDLTPYPSLIALSAAANILGEAKYIGKLPTPTGVTALVFQTPKGVVVAAWSDVPAMLPLPGKGKTVSIENIFGAESELPVSNNSVHISVGKNVVYVNVNDESTLHNILRPIMPKFSQSAPHPSRIVLSGNSALNFDRNQDSYIYSYGSSIPYEVQVYNFDKTAHTGTISLALPPGWTTSPTKVFCQIAPMGRLIYEFTVDTGNVKETDSREIIARGVFKSENTAPTVSSFYPDMATVPPTQEQSIDVLPASKWNPNIVSGGINTIKDIPNGVRIEAKFHGGDHWVYPVFYFDQPINLSDYDGIAFDMRAEWKDPNTMVRMIIGDTCGSTFIEGTPPSSAVTHVVFLFKCLGVLSRAMPDSPDRLDATKITKIQFGANAPGNTVAVEISNVKAVKFSTAP